MLNEFLYESGSSTDLFLATSRVVKVIILKQKYIKLRGVEFSIKYSK